MLHALYLVLERVSRSMLKLCLEQYHAQSGMALYFNCSVMVALYLVLDWNGVMLHA